MTIIRVLFLLILWSSCVKTDSLPSEPTDLLLLETHNLNIEDPSGLSKSNLPGHLYTVCDKRGRIYLINLTGEILIMLDIDGDDLEGIVYVENPPRLYALEERLRKVVKVSLGGEILATYPLDIPAIYPNDGPEGITYNPEKNVFYVVNEKNPSKLYVFDEAFNRLEDYDLDFAADYSALDYEPEKGDLWILSEQSALLARCNLQGEPLDIYNTHVPDGEGLVIDKENDRIYIVCDETSTLYIFQFPEE